MSTTELRECKTMCKSLRSLIENQLAQSDSSLNVDQK